MITAREGVGRTGAAILLASIVVLVSIPFDLIPMLRGPAPYPPEWQWAFRPEGPARPLLAAGACALALLALLWASGTGWARSHPTAARRALVAGAVILGCGLQLGLLAREPGPVLRTLLSRARSASFTSYHTVAISPEACEIKGCDSPVDGRADILVFPNIESGNVFYKSATLLSGGRLAAAVVGTSVPCVLTSRADPPAARLASTALAAVAAGI